MTGSRSIILGVWRLTQRKKIRRQATEIIYSASRLKTPFTVRKDIVAQNRMILQPNDTKLMYVYLKAVTDDYKQPSEAVSFEYL